MGDGGPAEIPAKRAYVFKDALRRAHRLGVPLAPPPSHPFNPLLALRVSSISMQAQVKERRALIDALFHATWGRGSRGQGESGGGGERGAGGVETAGAVTAIASACGLDGARLVVEAETHEAKARLRRQTDEAIALGVFGVPTMLVDGELFWGSDSLEPIDAYLSGEDPVRPELLAQWAHIAPSASRTG